MSKRAITDSAEELNSLKRTKFYNKPVNLDPMEDVDDQDEKEQEEEVSVVEEKEEKGIVSAPNTQGKRELL